MIPPELLHPAQGLGSLLPLLAARAGRPDMELRWVRESWERIPQLVAGAGPALLTCFPEEGEPQLLAVVGPAGWRGVPLMDQAGRLRHLPVASVVAALRAGLERSQRGPVESLLDEAGLQGRSRERVRERLLAERLRGAPIGGLALLCAAPHASPAAHLREAGLLGPLMAALLCRGASLGVGMGGWWLVGAGMGGGSLAAGWVAGWALMLLSSALLEQGGALARGELALRASAWLKPMLLRGVMKSEPELFRREGSGTVLARVQESQALEDLVLSGGLGALLALVDIAAAAAVLWWAPGAPLLIGLLLAATLATGLGALRLLRLQGGWTAARRGLTRDLVEKMVGHRTRLSQARPQLLHEGEDEALRQYHARSQALDAHRVGMESLPGGAFLCAALLVVGLLFSLGSSEGLGAALGGLLLGQGALFAISSSISGLVAALISWREVRDLLAAARAAPPAPALATAAGPTGPGQVLMRAEGLGYGWPERPPLLRELSFVLRQGDRVLLSGPSGCGKSTLASLLCGRRSPGEGLLLLAGLDRPTLGPEAWRRRVVLAPQFHENHVFEGTLAFNLLLGREWPASPAELEEAHRLCEELGLGEMIGSMPAGLAQPVGASGWQMSHGEQSRVFLARALLQGAELVILDETFGALDPLTLRRCLEVAERRAQTLIVVGHFSG